MEIILDGITLLELIKLIYTFAVNLKKCYNFNYRIIFFCFSQSKDMCMNSLKIMFFAVVIFPFTVQSSASLMSVSSKIVNDVSKVQAGDIIVLHDEPSVIQGSLTKVDRFFSVSGREIGVDDSVIFYGTAYFPFNDSYAGHFIYFPPTNPVIQDRHNPNLFHHTQSKGLRRK